VRLDPLIHFVHDMHIHIYDLYDIYHLYTYIHIYIYICIYHLYTYIHIYIYNIYIHICVCLCVCVCVCVCVCSTCRTEYQEGVQPQTHFVRARTDENWHKTNPDADPQQEVHGHVWFSSPVHEAFIVTADRRTLLEQSMSPSIPGEHVL